MRAPIRERETAAKIVGKAGRIDPVRPDPTRLIRFRELRTMIPLSRTTIWRQIRAGTLPKPVRIGKNAIAWRMDQILAYIEQLKQS